MKLKRKLVLKALTDPKFRKLLEENPEAALSDEELKEALGGEDVKDVLGTADYIGVISQIIAGCYFCVHVSDPF
jgi:hypothetical protein